MLFIPTTDVRTGALIQWAASLYVVLCIGKVLNPTLRDDFWYKVTMFELAPHVPMGRLNWIEVQENHLWPVCGDLEKFKRELGSSVTPFILAQ
jgi:hypothetical protein